MKLMTTHQLGQQPGRARLGAFDRVRPTAFATASRANAYGTAWPVCPSNLAAAPMSLATGTTGTGTGTGVKGIKAIAHPSRHLGVRTT